MKAIWTVLTVMGGIALAAVLLVLLIFGWPMLLVLAAAGLAVFLLLGSVMALGTVFTRAGEVVLGSHDVKPATPGEPSTAEWLEGFNARMAEREAAEEAARVQRRIDREKRIAEDRERKAQEEWERLLEKERQAQKEWEDEMERFEEESRQFYAENRELFARADEIAARHTRKTRKK